MKQYWTPLAKWLGMAKAPQDPLPAEQTVSAVATNRSTAAVAVAPLNADALASEADKSHWPDLFRALRTHAQLEWVARSQRHADINPDERLAITHLQIRAGTPALDAQLQQWFSESDVPHLIQWMVRGPFNTPNLSKWVVLDTLQDLQVLPLTPAEQPDLQQVAQPAPSPYDVTAARPVAATFDFAIVAQTRWAPRPAGTPSDRSLPPLELVIHDAVGERRVHVNQTLVVLGAEKTLKTPEGQKLRLVDQSPVTWQDETAWFVAVHAQHVSGMHLVLRLHEEGVDCLDAGSTNGSWVAGQALIPGDWRRVKHTETLFLGGVAQDPRHLTACVQLRVGHPVVAVSAERTPLRQSPAPASPPSVGPEHAPAPRPQARPKVVLQPLDSTTLAPLPIWSLPCRIGRAPDADWVVPAHHEMVSRQHVVIEAVDEVQQQVLLRDVSRQGLTQSQAGWRGQPAEGAWVSFSDTLTLGQSGRHPGFRFGFLADTRDPQA